MEIKKFNDLISELKHAKPVQDPAQSILRGAENQQERKDKEFPKTRVAFKRHLPEVAKPFIHFDKNYNISFSGDGVSV